MTINMAVGDGAGGGGGEEQDREQYGEIGSSGTVGSTREHSSSKEELT